MHAYEFMKAYYRYPAFFENIDMASPELYDMSFGVSIFHFTKAYVIIICTTASLSFTCIDSTMS